MNTFGPSALRANLHLGWTQNLLELISELGLNGDGLASNQDRFKDKLSGVTRKANFLFGRYNLPAEGYHPGHVLFGLQWCPHPVHV
jgi:hypothetical protein